MRLTHFQEAFESAGQNTFDQAQRVELALKVFH